MTSSPSSSLDLITHLAFSPLRTHLATASLDHHIRILHPSPSPSSSSAALTPHSSKPSHSAPTTTGESQAQTWTHAPREWKAHDGPVLCLAWAAPEFGTVLASGGVDGVVKIWREDSPPPTSSHSSTSSALGAKRAGAGGSTGQGWSLSATLTDSLGTLRSLSFSPAAFGLRLAGVASDSHLRVWDCLDPVSLREWVLSEDVELAGMGFGGVSSLGAAGEHPQAGPGDREREREKEREKATASAQSTASSSIDGRTGTNSLGGGGAGRGSGTVESDGGWAVSWCPEEWWGARLAVSAGVNGAVRVRLSFLLLSPFLLFVRRVLIYQDLSEQLFHFPSASASASASSPTPQPTWTQFLVLSPPPFPTSSSSSSSLPSSLAEDPSHPPSAAPSAPTSSLAWSPPSGRSFLLLAAGARDGRARVWRLAPPSLAAGEGAPASLSLGGGGETEVEGPWTARLDAELDPSAAAERAAAAGEGRRGEPAPGAGGGALGALGAVKVEWNVTGTVLSTTGGGGGGEGEGGRVRLWKPTYTGQWRLLATLSSEDTSSSSTAASTSSTGPQAPSGASAIAGMGAGGGLFGSGSGGVGNAGEEER
ncbi:hypothetical protein JCM10207_000321 [Rhodosporidiobolus poonsookiae]